ncbi:MAG: flagellar brake protein [Ruminiclostridium sp.]|nr:flagellar brake protein [Ruminiclostridium sp.]
MKVSDLEIGTKLELEIYDRNEQAQGLSLVSEFEWLVDPTTLMIAAPIFERVIYPLRIGTLINIYYIRKAAQEYELYTFKANVLKREMNENMALLRIGVISEIERIQRRQYFRLGCSIPVKFRAMESMNDTADINTQFKTTIANNLSGGGICLLLEEKLDVGKLLECEIATDGKKGIRFFGKVKRYEKNVLHGKFKYEIGIAFININNNDREKVVKFIFEEQRKLRKRGLI